MFRGQLPLSLRFAFGCATFVQLMLARMKAVSASLKSTARSASRLSAWLNAAPQERTLVSVAALPLAQSDSQARESAENAVGRHPIPQPLPLLD